MSPLFPCSCFLRVTPLCLFLFFFSTRVVVIVVSSLSRVRLFATPWTVARQVPSSMGFFRQEHWTGDPGDLSRHATHVSCFPGRLFTTELPGKPSEDGKKQIKRASVPAGIQVSSQPPPKAWVPTLQNATVRKHERTQGMCSEVTLSALTRDSSSPNLAYRTCKGDLDGFRPSC